MNAGTGVDAIGESLFVEGHRHIILAIASDGGGDANATLRFQGSVGDTLTAETTAADTPPDFSATQSITNHYDFVQVIDLQDGAPIDGDTGIVFASADDNRLVEVNVNGLRWFNVRLTAHSAGEITVKAVILDN